MPEIGINSVNHAFVKRIWPANASVSASQAAVLYGDT